ncbi:hypothetical protein [Paenibacillus oleatilyticus]|uniref:hypothetical protein n=1 Tax=Paenibacillus oleatilyticus TaxID=2594886 RepID=UPI001C1F51F1|nr:hypothetical protein [Paenibacillus oleatilyticus]MBU7315956.1 hypothetical protein [Paenibacillus oleatilyticus]
MLKVKISIDDGAGKKADIEINETDNLSKLVIIQNVFQLFGIDSDIMEMAKNYQRIGEAYSAFFNQIEPIEPTTINKIESDMNEIKEKLIQGFTENKEELETTYKETDDQPEFIRTGIREREDGTKLYRLHYKCIACWNRGNYWVYQDSKRTWCHRCQHELNVYPAHPEGFPNRDTFGNFFVAGDFKDWNLNWS